MAVLVLLAGIAALTAYAQQGQWAAADDTTAKFMIDAGAAMRELEPNGAKLLCT